LRSDLKTEKALNGKSMKKHLMTLVFSAVAAVAFAVNFDLAGTWRLEKASEPNVACPIAVPGGVHSALLKAGLMKDAFWGQNEKDMQWVGKSDWNISRDFDVGAEFLAKKEIVLRLEDCDCFCTVFVNGQKVGETTDRFQRYTFDVKPFLKEGKNTIVGKFRSPENEADKRREAKGRAFPMSNVMWAENQAFVRKAACHAGWDWGPAVQVIGFCGTTKLIATDGPRVEYVYSTQEFNDDFTHCTLTMTAELSDGNKVEKKFEIDNPPLWWPNGAGEQKFYTVGFEAAGQMIVRKIGLRKVEVLNEKTVSASGKDELSLVFRVNGRRLFMKGANWIPCSAYENEQTPDRYAQLLESARQANMNMIRVWGGGQYEKDCFYKLCDEKGLLIWHDMMCSCAVYPGDDAFLGEIRDEVTHQLKRLRDHASIAMWCGDNECLGAIGWFDVSRKDPDFYRGEWIKRSKLQGDLVAKYDPQRTYWPSSPCCGPGDFGDGWKEDSKGDMHNWDVWHENQPFVKYYEYHPRFCSEFGFQSFPSMEIAETFASKEQILARGPDFEWHQKNPGGNERIRKTFARYFREPKDVPSELLLSQFQQAMAIQTAVDAWRAEQPRCMGTLIWQLNDNWPVSSWSSIEYGGKWKPLHYLAKRFFEPVHVTLAPDGSIKVINDTDKPVSGKVIAVCYSFDGSMSKTSVASGVTVPACSAVTLEKIELRKNWVLELRFGDSVNFPVRAAYNDVELPKANVKAEIDGFKVTLTTDKPAFWVWMNVKGIRGEFDDNAVTLVPGVKRVFTFEPADKATTPEAFKAAFSVTHLVEITK
jgi:beta-mannosidase